MHDQPVESEGDAAVRRRTVLEGAEQEAELHLRLLRAQADQVEDLLLHVRSVDTDGAAADLAAVADEVVAGADAVAGIGLEQSLLAGVRRGEGVVQRDPPVRGLVEFEHREVDDPDELPRVLVDEIQILGDPNAELADRLGRGLPGVGGEEDGVSLLASEAFDQFGGDRFDEAADAGLESVSRALGRGDTAGAEGLDPLRVAVGHLAGQLLGPAGNPERLDDAATHGARLLEGRGEHAEVGLPREVADVGDLQTESQVRSVDAVVLHRVAPGHPRDVPDLDAEEFPPERLGELAHRLEDVVAIDEAHLEVDLGELRLAVGPGVLVAKTLGQLDVPFAAGDHEDLLEELGALRQGVPAPRLEAAGHDEVAGAFGGRLDEERRLDLEELALVEEGAGELGDPGAGLEDALHLRPAKIEIAVLESRLLADLLRLVVVGQDRRGLRLVEDLEFEAEDLDLPRVELRVRSAVALADRAADRDDVLATQALRGVHHVGRHVGEVEDDLGQAMAIPKIDEHQGLGVVAIGVDPSGEDDGLVDVFGTKGVAGMGPLEHGGSRIDVRGRW